MSETTPAEPSSTVVVAREGTAEPELFMVRRHAGSSFGTAYAFPGGVIEEDDKLVHAFCIGLGAVQANSRLGVRENGLDYFSAAIRELFEESGVLLADATGLDGEVSVIRDALNTGNLRWSDVVLRNELELRCDELHYFSHWVTPSTQPRRYSTRFFLAELPHGQSARHCGGELTDSCWATAHEMLDAGREGRVKLHFPTVKTLESLARHKTLEALLHWARSCVEWGVTSMVPEIIMRDGKHEIVLPGELGYPGAKS